MVHRQYGETLDRILANILGVQNNGINVPPLGVKVVVFGGDFRHILYVIPKGSRQDILNASFNSSILWYHCNVLKLIVCI